VQLGPSLTHGSGSSSLVWMSIAFRSSVSYSVSRLHAMATAVPVLPPAVTDRDRGQLRFGVPPVVSPSAAPSQTPAPDHWARRRRRLVIWAAGGRLPPGRCLRLEIEAGVAPSGGAGDAGEVATDGERRHGLRAQSRPSQTDCPYTVGSVGSGVPAGGFAGVGSE
jgi:hypothetical protein